NWSTTVGMYCLGVRRSATFSPRAIRSRSRWRIFSRSTATAFMRLPSASLARSGIASVSTVAIAAIAANTIAMLRGFVTKQTARNRRFERDGSRSGRRGRHPGRVGIDQERGGGERNAVRHAGVFAMQAFHPFVRGEELRQRKHPELDQ